MTVLTILTILTILTVLTVCTLHQTEVRGGTIDGDDEVTVRVDLEADDGSVTVLTVLAVLTVLTVLTVSALYQTEVLPCRTAIRRAEQVSTLQLEYNLVGNQSLEFALQLVQLVLKLFNLVKIV